MLTLLLWLLLMLTADAGACDYGWLLLLLLLLLLADVLATFYNILVPRTFMFT